MEPSYDSNDVRDICERHEAAVARFGQVAAAELQMMIADFNAAETAAEFISLRPGRFVTQGPHGLIMTLRCGLCLRFVTGHPIKMGRMTDTTDWAKTSRLRFMTIEMAP